MVTGIGAFSQVHVLRLDPGEDVMDSLIGYCREKNIRNGVLCAMHGSLARAEYFTVQPRPDISLKYGYTDAMVFEDICELIAASGTITHEEDGTINAHVHCSFGDGTGRIFGGHMKSGNKVLLVTEIVIGEIKDVELLGIRNEMGGILFTPTNR